jgi:acyl-CoA dehydrogenase
MASDRDGKEIVRAALQPGAFRDRLTRDIFVSDDPADRVGLLEYTLKKVIASEEVDKKLERAIRRGEVRRYHNNDWIEEAKSKGVLTADEASALAELRDLVARVIAVDDFDAASLAARHMPPEPKPRPVETEMARAEDPEHIAAE